MTILARFTIVGHSMEPTLRENQTILVSSLPFLFHPPLKGEIVAIKHPTKNKILIKRITKIENNHYFVTGDNHSDSTDSRKFGMIGRAQIIGKVVLKISNY